MALDQTKVQLQTVTPNVQTVQPVASAAPEMFSAVAGAALQGYSDYEIGRLYKDSEGIQDEFVENINLINKGEALKEEALTYLDQAGQDNPRVAELRKQYSKLDTAAAQRKDASLLYALKAENRLKESLRRTPGLRSQLTSAAAQALGVNPENYAIKTLIGNIEDEYSQWKRNSAATGADKNVALTTYNSFVSKMVERGYPAILVDDHTNTEKLSEASAQMNLMLSKDSQISQNMESLKLSIEANEITQVEGSSQLASLVDQGINLQIAPILDKARALGPMITTPEAYKQFKMELEPQLAGLRSLAAAKYDQVGSTINLGAEGAKEFNTRRDNAIQALDRSFSYLLNSDTYAPYQQYGTIAKAMADDYKMGFTEAHETTLYLMENLPGLMNASIQSGLLSAPELFKQLGAQLSDVIKGSAPAPKGSTLKGVISLMQRNPDYDNMSDADVAKAIDWSLETIKNKEAVDGSRGLTERDYQSLAGVLTNGLQMGLRLPDDRMMELADAVSGDIVQRTMEYLDKEGSWSSQYQRQTLGENALLALSRAIEKGVLPKAMRKGGTLGMKDVDYTSEMTFDMTTGQLKPSGKQKPELRPRQLYGRGTEYDIAVQKWNEETRRTRDAADTYNKYVDTIYKFREFDPAIKDLNKEQISYIVANQYFGSSNIKFTGNVPKFPDQKKDTAETYTDTRLKDLTNTISEMIARGSGDILKDPNIQSTISTIDAANKAKVDNIRERQRLAQEQLDLKRGK